MSPFEIVEAARALQTKLPSSNNVSVKTAEEYLKISRKLIREGRMEVRNVIRLAADTTKVRTWFKRRAALVRTSSTAVRTLLKEQDQLQRQIKSTPENDALSTKWLDRIRWLDFHVQLLTAMPIGCPIPEDKRKRRHSKKKDLRGLPDDWREQLYQRMGKYSLAFLVEAITGCRPGEFKPPVLIGIVDDELIINIGGKKVKENQGQPWRELAFKLPRDGLVGMLANLVSQQGNEIEVGIDDARNYSTAVRKAAWDEWPTRKTTVTPMCLRHLFSAEMKSAGFPREMIAAAMGQLVDTTCQQYASARQAGSISVVPDRTEAARPVRLRYEHNPPVRKKAEPQKR